MNDTWQRDRDYLLGSASQLLRMVVDNGSTFEYRMIREWLDGYTRMGRHERPNISYLPGTQEEKTK